MTRTQWLALDDGQLSEHCDLEFFRGSGPGGQKRNKCSSAVRVTLRELDLSAEDCTERSQHQNRARALAKLRRKIAFKLRESPARPPQRRECAVTAPDYPAWLGALLDVLEETDFDHKIAAIRIGVTASSLLRKIARDPEVWTFFNSEREKRGHAALHCP